MTEQLWIAPLDDVPAEYTAQVWKEAEFLLGELIDLSANFGNDGLILALHDAQVRAGIARERAGE